MVAFCAMFQISPIVEMTESFVIQNERSGVMNLYPIRCCESPLNLISPSSE